MHRTLVILNSQSSSDLPRYLWGTYVRLVGILAVYRTLCRCYDTEVSEDLMERSVASCLPTRPWAPPQISQASLHSTGIVIEIVTHTCHACIPLGRYLGRYLGTVMCHGGIFANHATRDCHTQYCAKCEVELELWPWLLWLHVIEHGLASGDFKLKLELEHELNCHYYCQCLT